MKRKIYNALAILAVCACVNIKSTTVAVTAQTPQTPTQSYGCNAVYPTQLYCPAGYVCTVLAPICIVNVSPKPAPAA